MAIRFCDLELSVRCKSSFLLSACYKVSIAVPLSPSSASGNCCNWFGTFRAPLFGFLVGDMAAVVVATLSPAMLLTGPILTPVGPICSAWVGDVAALLLPVMPAAWFSLMLVSPCATPEHAFKLPLLLLFIGNVAFRWFGLAAAGAPFGVCCNESLS